MTTLYHKVPPNMSGTVLYPLNQLKTINPDVYSEQVKKYEGREVLLERRIERLDCLWNDVIHLSPLHPELLVAELKRLGKEIHFECFEIPAETLEPERTVVYLNTPRERGEFGIPQSEFVPFDPRELGKYAAVPDGTAEYFKEALASNEQIFLYRLVPHVLYKGLIETRDLRRIFV